MCRLTLATLGVAAGASAQAVRMEVHDSVSGAPVVGALVSALDAGGISRADGLTSDRGMVTLRVPSAGHWTLVVRRIGLTPRRIPDVSIGAGETIAIQLSVAAIRQLLPAMRVTADAGTCGRAPTGDDRTSALWEQISIALRASTLTRDGSMPAPTLKIVERVRELSPSLEVYDTKITRDGYGAGRPYSAVHPDTLAARGYIRREENGDFSYFAPDEQVLLSDAFLATHCFDTPAKDEDPSLAELHFRPVRGRRLPDVEGTAFVDVSSGELRRIEFRFVNTNSVLPSKSQFAGGDVAMRRLANGQWIVTSWAIRMPLFERFGRPSAIMLRSYREVGGTVDPISDVPPDP